MSVWGPGLTPCWIRQLLRAGWLGVLVPADRSVTWDWWDWVIGRGCWGSGPFRRKGVVEFGASIDGSLWYGDLPALDGAETTDIAEALVSEFGWRPQHSKSPGFRVGVVCADVGVGCCRAVAARASLLIEPRCRRPSDWCEFLVGDEIASASGRVWRRRALSEGRPRVRSYRHGWGARAL